MGRGFPMKRERKGPYGLLVAGAVVWLLLVFLAPLARARGWAAAPWLYGFFHPICHQLPERSFTAFGQSLAVCHRCLGLYVGFLLGLLAWPRLERARRWLLAAPRWIVVFAVPMLLDVAWPGNLPPTRFVTGAMASFPVALLAWVAVQQIFRPSREESHELDCAQ